MLKDVFPTSSKELRNDTVVFALVSTTCTNSYRMPEKIVRSLLKHLCITYTGKFQHVGEKVPFELYHANKQACYKNNAQRELLINGKTVDQMRKARHKQWYLQRKHEEELKRSQHTSSGMIDKEMLNHIRFIDEIESSFRNLNIISKHTKIVFIIFDYFGVVSYFFNLFAIEFKPISDGDWRYEDST